MQHHEITIRNTRSEDIPKIVNLQKESFPYLAQYGNIWHPSELESHLHVFPEGQFCAELNGEVVASATSLIVTLNPEYLEHTWKQITYDGMLTNHNPKGDSLYGADISTHPKVRHEGIGKMLYNKRKDLEYAEKVIKGELRDLVLSFELENGFKFIKILPNYLNDIRSLNNASFIEWINPNYSTASSTP